MGGLPVAPEVGWGLKEITRLAGQRGHSMSIWSIPLPRFCRGGYQLSTALKFFILGCLGEGLEHWISNKAVFP